MWTIWHTKLQKISIHFLTFGGFWNILRNILFKKKSMNAWIFLLIWLQGVENHPITHASCNSLVRNVCQSLSYTKEPLQESLGSTEINAGDATVTPEHAVHRGGNLLPVTLCVRVESCLVFCDVAHPVTDKPFTLRRNPIHLYLQLRFEQDYLVHVWCNSPLVTLWMWPEYISNKMHKNSIPQYYNYFF